MADLVLGLAKSAVEGTLTAAKSAIDEEEKLKKSVQRDLVLIKDEFEMMRSFLVVAKEHAASDEMLKTLVRQVRNIALDVEDIIESAVLVDVDKIRRWWWSCLIPSCMPAGAPVATLNDAVATAQLLKSRVEAMGQRNERYMHIGGATGGSKPAENDKTHQQAVADAANGILKEAREAKKRQGSPRDLVELIKKKTDVRPLQVISVWGAAGDLGVASIIKKTCDDPEICSKFSCRAWVKLPQPFNPNEFIRSLMAQFYTNSLPQQGPSGAVDLLKQMDEMTAMEATQLTEEFLKQVTDHTCLIFLEDVPTTVVWEAVRLCLPDKKNGSCIVVHTQQLEVASLVVGQSQGVLELEQFSDGHSVCAFFNEKTSSLKDLIELINKENDVHAPLQVISMCGEVGDDAFASIINNSCGGNLEICQKFKYRACVKLRHPFSHLEFIKSLLAQILTNYCPQHGSAQDFLKLKGLKMVIEEALIVEFVKQVMGDERYLVFLEDVSSKDDWNTVRKYLPDANGSCIVVHTQKREVASFCAGQSHRLLQWDLFLAEHSVRVFIKEGEDEEMAIKKNNANEWLPKNELIGRGADKDWLSGNYPEVQPVFGMAGVGKSYIVKHVYYSEVIKDNKTFKNFGWVDITHPLNIRDFSWNLLLDLHSGSLQRGKMLRIRDPIQECRQLLKDHTCLVVIDGLQSKQEWDSIKSALAFEHEQNRSRIIVIAYEESVAKYCSPDNCWSVEGLEIGDALDLFKRTASRCHDSRWTSEPSPSDTEFIKSVLHKCGGLPKVIVPMANFMARGWYPNLDEFMPLLETNADFVSLRDLFSWVHTCFQSCRDELKPCIFYLSIFPANHRIRRRRLVRRWIAEGYSTDTRESTAEEKGGEFFEDLCHRNMVQVPGSTNVSYVTRMSACQVNGFIREYIMSRSMEENLVFALEGNCSANSQRSGRHLTIGSTWDRDMSVYRSIDLSKLRSLTVFGKWEPSFISDDKARLLRVLDLEDATSSSVTDADLELIVKLLPRLKFLSLRGCKQITHLPDSFGSLRQLQTLDIRHTSIVKLPRSFTKLKKLQHISGGTTATMDDYSSIVESPPPPLPEATIAASMTTPSSLLPSPSRLWPLHGERLPTGSPNGGIELPRGIGKMIALQNISVIDISIASRRRPVAVLEELNGLNQLRKFGVSGVNSENCKELCSAISGHPHLESLSVWLDKNQAGCLDSISPPPGKLESLKLHGHVGKLPEWISELSNLRKLKLRVTMITQDDVDLLRFLSRLSTLCLGFSEVEHGELRFCRNGMWCFRQLLILEITCNSMLKSVMFGSSVMPWLEVLKIHCSNVSSIRFSGLQELPKLREVSVSGTYDDKVWQQLKSNLDEHQREIKPVLKPASPSGR